MGFVAQCGRTEMTHCVLCTSSSLSLSLCFPTCKLEEVDTMHSHSLSVRCGGHEGSQEVTLLPLCQITTKSVA